MAKLNYPATSVEASADPDASLLSILDFLRQVCRNLLGNFPDIKRWDHTDDVFQAAALKLFVALQETTPESRRHLENLAAVQVRRTLIDLGRKYAAQVAMNQQRWTPDPIIIPIKSMDHLTASSESDPQKLIEWVELHEQIDHLPDEAREVFQLIWYRGMSKHEVAELLAVDLRTVQRRWRMAREFLADSLIDLNSL